jgi:hypothetical protein
VAATRATAESPLSLVGARLLWSGLANSTEVLHQPVAVLRPLAATFLPRCRTPTRARRRKPGR